MKTKKINFIQHLTVTLDKQLLRSLPKTGTSRKMLLDAKRIINHHIDHILLGIEEVEHSNKSNKIEEE